MLGQMSGSRVVVAETEFIPASTHCPIYQLFQIQSRSIECCHLWSQIVTFISPASAASHDQSTSLITSSTGWPCGWSDATLKGIVLSSTIMIKHKELENVSAKHTWVKAANLKNLSQHFVTPAHWQEAGQWLCSGGTSCWKLVGTWGWPCSGPALPISLSNPNTEIFPSCRSLSITSPPSAISGLDATVKIKTASLH